MRCNEMCGMQLWPRYLEPREWVGLVERWQVWLWCSCSDRGRSGGWRAGGPNPQTAVAKCTLPALHAMHAKYTVRVQTIQCRRTQPSNCSRTACEAQCTLPALHSLHAKYKLYNVGGLSPHSSNCTLQLLAMHSKYSVHCILHGVVHHYTIHNGHCTVHTLCTMPSDAVLSCSSAANIMLAT